MTNAELGAFVRRNPISFGCGLLAVVLAVATYYRKDSLPEAQTLLDQRVKEGTRLDNNVRYGAQLTEQLATLTAAGREIQSHLVRGSELAGNLQYFYRLEAETGAKIIELRQNGVVPPPKGTKATYVGVSFTVSMQGDYPVVLDVLRRLENGNHFCRVTSVNVAPIGPDRATPLKLALGLELLGQP